MSQYNVLLPVVGHAFLSVEAATEQEAIQKAIVAVTVDDVETLIAVENFAQSSHLLLVHKAKAWYDYVAKKFQN